MKKEKERKKEVKKNVRKKKKKNLDSFYICLQFEKKNPTKKQSVNIDIIFFLFYQSSFGFILFKKKHFS